MNLKTFLSLNGEYFISTEEAQSLNEDLATISALDIPNGDRARVADYLISALNLHSVRREISPALDSLLSELQSQA